MTYLWLEIIVMDRRRCAGACELCHIWCRFFCSGGLLIMRVMLCFFQRRQWRLKRVPLPVQIAIKRLVKLTLQSTPRPIETGCYTHKKTTVPHVHYIIINFIAAPLKPSIPIFANPRTSPTDYFTQYLLTLLTAPARARSLRWRPAVQCAASASVAAIHTDRKLRLHC